MPCCSFVAAAAAACYVFRVGPSLAFIYALCALCFVLLFALLGVSWGGRWEGHAKQQLLFFLFVFNQLNSKFKLNYGTFKQIFNAAVNEVY